MAREERMWKNRRRRRKIKWANMSWKRIKKNKEAEEEKKILGSMLMGMGKYK